MNRRILLTIKLIFVELFRSIVFIVVGLIMMWPMLFNFIKKGVKRKQLKN